MIGGHTGGTAEGNVDVVFGATSGLVTANIGTVVSGTGGFRVTGEAGGDNAGVAVSTADVNGDGFD
ncbi:MAG: hypothetical protein OXT01_29230, partial [Rhodospirillaceae bacterium]|nr:hypothetical protein [Rhodospirillaceae bacterium]